LFTAEPQILPVHAAPLSVHPHTFGVPPPPHVSGAVHVPQSSVLPQRSSIDPQFKPNSAHVTAKVQAPPAQHCPAPHEETQKPPLQQAHPVSGPPGPGSSQLPSAAWQKGAPRVDWQKPLPQQAPSPHEETQMPESQQAQLALGGEAQVPSVARQFGPPVVVDSQEPLEQHSPGPHEETQVPPMEQQGQLALGDEAQVPSAARQVSGPKVDSH
jgi:hypothetical protein